MNFLIIVGSLAAVLNAKDVGELCEDAFAAGNYAEAAITCDRAILQHPEDAFYKRLQEEIQKKMSQVQIDSVQHVEADSGLFVDPRDGQVYNWRDIGTRRWMTRNMGYLPYLNTTKDVSDILPRFAVYDYRGNDLVFAKEMAGVNGVLYNWPAAMQACPVGWHLATGGDWDDLENVSHKEGACLGFSLNEKLYPKSRTRTANVFNAVLSGQFNESGFSEKGEKAFWWTSLEQGYSIADSRGLDLDSSELLSSSNPKSRGFSVRCVQVLVGSTKEYTLTDARKTLSQVDGFKEGDTSNFSRREKASMYEWSSGAQSFGSLIGGSTGTGSGGSASTSEIKRADILDELNEGAGRSKQNIMLVVRARSPGLRYIYNKFQKQGFVGGRIVIRFAIAPSGEVISATKSGSNTGNSAFDSEIIVKVSEWNFGPAPKSGNTTVTIPITFSE